MLAHVGSGWDMLAPGGFKITSRLLQVGLLELISTQLDSKLAQVGSMLGPSWLQLEFNQHIQKSVLPLSLSWLMLAHVG